MKSYTAQTMARIVLMMALAGACFAEFSRPGGAGYAMLFRDHAVVLQNMQGMDTDAFTFEAWLSTSSYCQSAAIMSYAQHSTSLDPHQRTADFNDFVVFDPENVVACRGFEYIDLWPDPLSQSCYSKFNHSDYLPNIVERDGRWHHLAVTWTAANNGLTRIYVDGLLRAEAPTGKTAPLRSGGAFMLGGEQDCYGGCTDIGQGYHGYMEEVRLWKVARSQEDILKHMRDYTGLDNHPDLIAYWKFNDPEENGMFRQSSVARDSSGKGNDLPLVTLPQASLQSITSPTSSHKSFNTGVLSFSNNYAINMGFPGIPQGDFTVEFWARVPTYDAGQEVWSEFFSFATFLQGGQSGAPTQFLDDAILIERYTQEFSGSEFLDYLDLKTAGSVSVHINANRQGMGQGNDHWIDYAVNWTDDQWHHVAVSWVQSTGQVSFFYDGTEQTPFWVSKGGNLQVKDPNKGGVDRHIAAGTFRKESGSLVVGNKQECLGGCFSPQYGYHGDLASLRIWNRALSQNEVQANMYTTTPTTINGLVFSYDFDPVNLVTAPDGQVRLIDTYSPAHNDLYFGGDTPTWVYSTAPLADALGVPVSPAYPGAAGHALHLSDQQVLITRNFQNFPSDEITVEFWMLSVDSCRKGTPFSYASPGATYATNDNTFLVSNYNDWVISVVEDEGRFNDHTSGISATDGKWHHIAVTWRSYDGMTVLYDNGQVIWSVVRARGKKIPSGGTLVVGREQDCEGGCFDSQIGGTGDVTRDWENLEYGSQDFFGVIDELRIWKKARSPEQIQSSMKASLYIKGNTGQKIPQESTSIDPADPDLVAYYNFDEGAGYLVKDVTGRGNDLIATQPPRWEVVKSLSVCGNGVLEGLEECDDGDTRGGDGCSSACTIESGYDCTRTSPSICWLSGGDAPRPPPPFDPSVGPVPPPGPSPPGSNHNNKKSHHHVFTVLFSIIVVAGLGFVALSKRQDIFDRFPGVESSIYLVTERVKGFFGQRFDRYGNGLSLDPEDHAGAPDFSMMRPEPARRAGYDPLASMEPWFGSVGGRDGAGERLL